MISENESMFRMLLKIDHPAFGPGLQINLSNYFHE
jgi:hypothetical protein